MKDKLTPRRVLAWIAIILLILLTLTDLILAVIGTEFTYGLLKATLFLTIICPILIYACLIATRATTSFRRTPEDDLSEEEKIGYYHMIEERDEKRRAEQEEKKAARAASRKARRTGKKQ